MCCLILLDADAKEYYNSAEQIVPVGRPQEQRSHHHCSSISGISNITATQCSGGARALCVTCDGGDGGKFQSFCNCSIVPISHSLSCSFSNPTTRYKRSVHSFLYGTKSLMLRILLLTTDLYENNMRYLVFSSYASKVVVTVKKMNAKTQGMLHS